MGVGMGVGVGDVIERFGVREAFRTWMLDDRWLEDENATK